MIGITRGLAKKLFIGNNEKDLLGVGGQGYSWVDETANRASGTTYTNTMGKPLQVNVSAATSENQNVRVDGLIIGFTTSTSTNTPFNFIVPSGSTYKFSDNTATTISYWAELK